MKVMLENTKYYAALTLDHASNDKWNTGFGITSIAINAFVSYICFNSAVNSKESEYKLPKFAIWGIGALSSLALSYASSYAMFTRAISTLTISVIGQLAILFSANLSNYLAQGFCNGVQKFIEKVCEPAKGTIRKPEYNKLQQFLNPFTCCFLGAYLQSGLGRVAVNLENMKLDQKTLEETEALLNKTDPILLNDAQPNPGLEIEEEGEEIEIPEYLPAEAQDPQPDPEPPAAAQPDVLPAEPVVELQPEPEPQPPEPEDNGEVAAQPEGQPADPEPQEMRPPGSPVAKSFFDDDDDGETVI